MPNLKPFNVIDDLTYMVITASDNNPRVGIGTTNPITTFEFKETSDTVFGSELLLVGSRTTKGADIGDTAGIVNFAIETGSSNFTQTGSVGKIKGIVTSEAGNGVTGKIAFELFKGVHSSEDAIQFGFNIGNNGTLYNAIYSSSIELKDFSPTGYSRLSMYDNNNNRTFEILQGSLTASGDISSSGNIVGTINGGSF